jgi:hypothetical protein
MVRFEKLPDDAPDPVQNPDDGQFYCPVCRDFTGERSSVEAHITGKSDAEHKGLVGKDFRVVQRNGPDLLSAGQPVLKNDNGVTFFSESEDPERPSSSDQSPAEDTSNGLFAAGVLVGILVWVLRNTGKSDQAVTMLR